MQIASRAPGLAGRFVLDVCRALLVVVLVSGPALAGDSWFSKVRRPGVDPSPVFPQASNDSNRAVFDIVISLYNDPMGDDDPDNDLAGEEQAEYEEIIRFWADTVCEQTNGTHKLGKVRIFRNGARGAEADVVWNAEEDPRANPSGFGGTGLHIFFGDVFPDGSGEGVDKDMLADPEGAGYTLGHEWGHYVLTLFDEYRGSDPSETSDSLPQTGDVPVVPSIMNSQWSARGGSFEWLNHSTSNNIGDLSKTAQGRVYGKSAWDVLIQSTDDDPKSGDLTILPTRVRYANLVSQEPTALDNWVIEDLPAAQASCRSALDIIWMQDQRELQLVIDSSGSMSGAPIQNARGAGQTLVDVVEEGATAMGVVTFDSFAAQRFPITFVPDPGDAVKSALKSSIAGIQAGGATALFDGADLALSNLETFAAAGGSDAAEVVFLLSDGMDNSSFTNESAVLAAYQAADVPLVTFGYGSFAPTGVLRRLADNTGGDFFASPTTLAEIQAAFLAASATVSASTTVAATSATAPAGTSTAIEFPVDSTLADLSLTVSFIGSAGDLDFTLLANGMDTGTGFRCETSGVEASCHARVEEATFFGTGPWTLEVSSQAGADVPFDLFVVGEPAEGRIYDLRLSSLGGSTVTFPEPALLTAAVSRGHLITGADIVAAVTSPTGAVTDLPMNDEGENGDKEAGDGIYSAATGYSEQGTHTVQVTVSNDSGEAEFTDGGLLPAHPSAAEDGTTPAAPPLPPIDENFMRTAIAQFTVQGLQPDDHADTLPDCTMIVADNADTPGSIDRTADVDCFLVTGIDTGRNLVVRATDLGLGMLPRVTVLTPDGSTPVLQGTLEDSASASGYVLLQVPAGALDATGEMLVNVEHVDVNAASGVYAVSAGAPIVSDVRDVIEAAVDIRPESRDNPIHPGSGGVVPVAILGSAAFDVSEVDVSTLAFGPAGAPPAHGNGPHFQDASGDGIVDLLAHFRTRETGIAMGDEEACVRAETLDGRPVEGCDSIATVPRR